MRVAVIRTDATPWRSVAGLFPELVAHGPAERLALVGRSVSLADSARRSRRHPVVAIAPGLLEIPPFTPATRWLSGTVVHTARQGTIGPGWCESALHDGRAVPRPGVASVVEAIVLGRVGGSFWAPPVDGDRSVVLVCGGPGAGTAALDAALARHDAADLLVLAEPGALAAQARRLGCAVVTSPVDPWSAIDRAVAIHVAGDHPIGLLAQFAGHDVQYHAPVWYGRTHGVGDIAAAWLAGTRHADPYSGRAATAEASIALLAEWRETLHANRGIACCVGISGWKRRRIAAFFHTGDRPPLFRRTAAGAVAAAGQAGGAIAVWNSRIPAGLLEAAAAAGVKVRLVEDGFVRSAGLGSDFLPPCSIIADSSGIYYDPRQPSDLERILAETSFDPALLARAARLVARLLADGVTKYGAGGGGFRLPVTGRRTILVPGQVADDLSVRLGAGAVRTNLDLLRQVRLANPNAFVIYKPHPDVEAGHRPGAIHQADTARLADLVVRGGAMSALIAAVDEVHTMTSLAGFEALLRGRAVCVYGQPFYAGWGLTRDLAPLPRRRRRLSLEELAAGVLILYPRYLDPVTSLPCGPELLIERLGTPELWRPGLLMRVRQLQGRLRRRFRAVAADR